MSDERNNVDKATAWDAIAGKNAEIATLRADRDKWHRVAMDAGAVTCVGGGHLFPLKEEVVSLRAKLESARKALENEREFWAGKVASAIIRKLPSSDAQDHVDRITAALTDETGKS